MKEEFVQKKGRCHNCLYCREIGDGCKELGCFCSPYDGEFIRDVRKCPKNAMKIRRRKI